MCLCISKAKGVWNNNNMKSLQTPILLFGVTSYIIRSGIKLFLYREDIVGLIIMKQRGTNITIHSLNLCK
jgi:hypothetical protein